MKNTFNFLLKSDTRRRNPVARNMNAVNRAETHRDRKNDYKRQSKYGLRWEDDAV